MTSEERKQRNRDAAAKHYLARRKLVDEIKLNSGCVDCGYKDHPAALQFDHRDPEEKLFRIAGSLHRKLHVLMAEIAKCDVRCANCHAVKTVNEPVPTRGRPRLEKRKYASDKIVTSTGDVNTRPRG